MGTGNGISEGRVDYKVPGGKLIRVRLRHRNGIIESVRFNGDFFIHPEEAIEGLEEKLSGKDVESAFSEIESFFEEVDAAGISPEDFKQALRLAMND